MDNPELTKLNVEISARDATEYDIDHMTIQLLSELGELDVESAELAKGELITIDSIAIEVLPAVLPSLIGLIQGCATHRQALTVKFKGKGIEFEGSIEKGKKKK